MTLFCKGRNGAEERETSCLEVAKWKPVAATFLMHAVHASSFMFLFLQWMAKAGLLPSSPSRFRRCYVSAGKAVKTFFGFPVVLKKKCKSATLPEREICMY